jgi:hypothetical protein
MAIFKSDVGAQPPLLVSLCDLRPASEKEFGIGDVDAGIGHQELWKIEGGFSIILNTLREQS